MALQATGDELAGVGGEVRNHLLHHKVAMWARCQLVDIALETRNGMVKQKARKSEIKIACV